MRQLGITLPHCSTKPLNKNMTTDIFLYDTEQLNQLASAEIVRQGLEYFTDNRVFAIMLQDGILSAEVEGSLEDVPYYLELSKDENKQLHCQCDCRSANKICKHAIASLYSYAEQCLNAETESFSTAIDEAIKERIKKGRNEVNVELLSGNLAFGVWKAKSIISATYRNTSYHVYIRALDQKKNYCTCPDLATNRLGTCKHIEAVLHYAKRKSGYKEQLKSGAPVSFVYLAWESATDPVIRLHKANDIEEKLNTELAEHFDAELRFTGRIPEDFNFFAEKFHAREDLQIGEDVLLQVKQRSEDAIHHLRAQEISQQIMQSNGILPGIKARLFPYQTEGVAFLASRGRALLADDMGLGKTIQAIAAASWLTDHSGVNTILVICPASLKHQWAREIEKFSSKSVQIIQGAAKDRAVQYRADCLFHIVNYELVLRDLSVINETLNPDLLILDEAQRIKNWRTKIASTVKLINSRYAFVLSGTPLENRIEDLYSLLQLVDARVLGPLWRCLLDFHISDEHGKVIGYRNLSELRQRITPVMLRRNRSLVSDQLPEKTQVTLDIEMSDKQKELHDSAMSAAALLADIAKRRPLTPSESNRMMAALQQARMACNAAGLVDKTTEGSPKLDELARLLETLCLQSNTKVVIFSQWALMTEMVETLVKSMGLGSVRLHGGVASHKRGELMNTFLNNESVQVFISTDAGGTGLNLQAAGALINLDMPWNPAVLDQRIARIHRLGQKQKVQVFILLAEFSYEQRVASLVKGKRDLFDNVISPDATEDVVGVSKKMLQTLVDDLGEANASDEAPSTVEQTIEIETNEDKQAIVVSKKAKTITEETDTETQNLITNIQACLSERLDRIVAAGGGLLAVVNTSHADDEHLTEELSKEELPVVIINHQMLANLNRLGTASPLSDEKVIYDAKQESKPVVNPLIKVAQDKLHSAEILIEQQCFSGVMEILASTMLTTAAIASGQRQIPSPENATVWLFGEALPKQWLTAEQVNTVVKVIALSQNIEVPETMVHQALNDARTLLANYDLN